MSLTRPVLAALAVLAGIGAARAAEPSPATYSIIVENDLFGFSGSDKRYTSGIEHEWLSGEGRGQRLARLFLRAGDGDLVRFGVGAGQSIFTPDDLASAGPLADQHPYAGWLYLEAKSVVIRASGATDTMSVAAGVVGPWSLAENTQRTLHRTFNFREPAGWDNQLRNEPGLVASLDRQWRLNRTDRGFGAEFLPHAGVSAGNVLTEARAGALLRIGSNLGGASLPARIGASIPRALQTANSGVAWQVFAGAQGRAVAHTIFLDGNSFRDSASVDKETLVGEIEAGFSLRVGRLAIGYAHVFRTRQFETEIGGHNFGALSVSAAF